MPFKSENCLIKVKTTVSQHCSCDADLTAEQAKDKIRKWIKAAVNNIPAAIPFEDKASKKTRHVP